MSFDQVRDQTIAIRLLRSMLRRNRVPNALLFWGAAGVGKGLTAGEFAKAINCAESNGDACGVCLSCTKIAHGNHPDLHIIAPVKKSRIISRGAIDDVIEMASLRPYEADARVFIIHEAERMQGPAQNHLLKTLEEPLGHSVFILITEHPQFLLPTIRSRCQLVRFGALQPETVADLLQSQRKIGDTEAKAIAALSQGQMARAFDLLDSEKRTIMLDVVTRLGNGEDPLRVSSEFATYLDSQRKEVEAAVKSNSENTDAKEVSRDERERMKEEQLALVESITRRDTMEHLYLLETWYRDVLVYAATGETDRVLNRDQLELLEGAAEGDGFEKLGAIEKARLYLERFLNEERVFRDLFFALAP